MFVNYKCLAILRIWRVLRGQYLCKSNLCELHWEQHPGCYLGRGIATSVGHDDLTMFDPLDPCFGILGSAGAWVTNLWDRRPSCACASFGISKKIAADFSMKHGDIGTILYLHTCNNTTVVIPNMIFVFVQETVFWWIIAQIIAMSKGK